jgi:hypothetical protein
MNRRTKKEAPAAVSELLKRVTTWRKERRKTDAMPDALWSAAAELGSRYGVSLVSRHLKVDFYGLKRRVLAVHDNAIAKSGFVELQCMRNSGEPEPTLDKGYVTELEIFKPGEITVRVRQSGPMGIDMVGVITCCFGRG